MKKGMDKLQVFKGILVICLMIAVWGLADLALTTNFFDFKTDYEPMKEVSNVCKEWVRK